MQSIKPEAREFITQASLGRASVEKVAAMLPDNDAELDEWIGEAGYSQILSKSIG